MLKSFRSRLLVIALLILPALSSFATKVHFEVGFKAPQTHYAQVEMQLSEVDADKVTVKMASWTPGSYLIREYARHLDYVKAFDTEGNKLVIEKVSKNTWEVTTGGASALSIAYEIYCFELTVRTCFIDDSHASIIPAGFFLYLADEDPEITIDFTPADHWDAITTALKTREGDDWKRTAPNKDILFDSPIEIGNQAIYNFEAAGIPHTLAIYGGGNYDATQMQEDLTLIVDKCTEIFGDNPCDDYTFIVQNTDHSYGGLEHLNSTSLIYGRFGYQPADRYRSFLGLAAHEYFHLWNVKRIRPEALGPFNYDVENYTHGLWVAEGFTSYYDDLIVKRTGLIDEATYLDILENNIASIERSPGNKVQPVAHASFDAWIKYYRRNENSGNTTVSYYTKGSVVACLIELEILRETKGKKRLDDLMQRLYKDWKKNPERGFTDEELQAAVEAVVGHDMDAFFQGYVFGTEAIDYARYFDPVGMEVKLTPSTDVELGVRIQPDGKIFRVVRGSSAYEAGINVNDELIAIDGYRIREGEVGVFLADKEVGDTIDLMLSRDGQIITITVKLMASTRPRVSLVYQAEITEEQQKLRDIWLENVDSE